MPFCLIGPVARIVMTQVWSHFLILRLNVTIISPVDHLTQHLSVPAFLSSRLITNTVSKLIALNLLGQTSVTRSWEVAHLIWVVRCSPCPLEVSRTNQANFQKSCVAQVLDGVFSKKFFRWPLMGDNTSLHTMRTHSNFCLELEFLHSRLKIYFRASKN